MCSDGQGAGNDHRVAEALQGDPLRGDRVGAGAAQPFHRLPDMVLGLGDDIISVVPEPQAPVQVDQVGLDQVGFGHGAPPVSTAATALANFCHSACSETRAARP